MTGVKRPFTAVDTNPTDSQPATQQSLSKKAAGDLASTLPICKSPNVERSLPSPSSQNSSAGANDSPASQPFSLSSRGKPLSPRPSSSDMIAAHPPKTQLEVLPCTNDTKTAETPESTSPDSRSPKFAKISDFHAPMSVLTVATRPVAQPAACRNGSTKNSSPSSGKAIKASSTGSVKITKKASKTAFVKFIKPNLPQGSTKKLVGKIIIKRPIVTTLPNGSKKIGSSSSEKSIKASNSGSRKTTKRASNTGSCKTTKQSSETGSIMGTKGKSTQDISEQVEDLDPEAMRVAVRKSALAALASLVRKKTNATKNSSNPCSDKNHNGPTEDTSKHDNNPPEAVQEAEQRDAPVASGSPERKNENAEEEDVGRNNNTDDDHNDDDNKAMENLVKFLPPQPIGDKVDCNTTAIDFDTLKRLGCRATMRSILWTSKFQDKLEIRSELALRRPVLEKQKEFSSHLRKLAEKAFRKVNNYRYFSGRDKLEWSEMLYEACSTCNCEMIGGGRFLERPTFNLGVETRSAAVRIFLRGDAVVARKEGYVNEPVTNVMLNEFKDRKYHKQTLLNSRMRYGAIDIFGNEENFSVVAVVSSHPPFYFSARRSDQ